MLFLQEQYFALPVPVTNEAIDKFKNINMPDIYISCDCNHWYESGPCRNLEIFNNIFSKKDSVKIEPISVNKPVKDVHRNIKIYDNKIGE